MLKRVAIDRAEKTGDVLLEFVPDSEGSRPDLIEVSADGGLIRVRLRMRLDELDVLAVALDAAETGGSGELYFEPKAGEN